MKESNITIDDVRWFLSLELCKKLTALHYTPFEMVNFIHSKELEVELYNIEEKFLEEMQRDYERRTLDEATIRETFYKINRAKVDRQRKNIKLEKKDDSKNN